MSKLSSATIVKVDGGTKRLRRRPTLKESQSIVGGYIELVKAKDLNGKPVVLVVCNDGKMLGQPTNNSITEEYGPSIYGGYTGFTYNDSIVGDVIVLRGYRTI